MRWGTSVVTARLKARDRAPPKQHELAKSVRGATFNLRVWALTGRRTLGDRSKADGRQVKATRDA